MNADRLLALFEQISEAPDAIPRLRRFILDLAVRGKLVEQDPEDEPAEELLGEIYESMILSGGRKRKTAESLTESDDAEPFEIPCSWAWVSLGQITDLITSGSRDWAKHYSGDGAIFVRMGNLSRHHYRLRLDSIQHVKPPAGGEGTRTSLQAWDVLVSITGDVGMLGLIPEGFGEAYINQHTALVRPCSLMKGRFLPEVLRSDFVQDQFRAPQRGIKNSFRLSDVANVLIPLPPLAEQHRIIAKVDELMALCDQLEVVRQERQQCRERLVAASLQRLNQPSDDPEAFHSDARFALQVLPSLTSTPAQIKQLRQTILNLAVRGKLVEQDPEDEPAEELLGEIYESMILSGGRKRKTAGSLTESDDAEPFEIPCSWAWVSLGRITDLITSGSRDWAKHYSGDGAIFVRMGNLSRHHYRLRLDSIQHVKPPAGGEGTRTSLQAWDVLVSITGDVGMLGLIPEGFGEAYINQHTALVRPCSLMKGRFLPELLRSDFVQDQFRAPQRGIKNSFRLSDVANVLIPLPPLAEQHRIVAKVEQLMAVCDQLERQLSQAEQSRRGLLEVVLREALAGRLPERPEERHAAIA